MGLMARVVGVSLLLLVGRVQQRPQQMQQQRLAAPSSLPGGRLASVVGVLRQGPAIMLAMGVCQQPPAEQQLQAAVQVVGAV
jgi:hypothetical protein